MRKDQPKKPEPIKVDDNLFFIETALKAIQDQLAKHRQMVKVYIKQEQNCKDIIKRLKK